MNKLLLCSIIAVSLLFAGCVSQPATPTPTPSAVPSALLSPTPQASVEAPSVVPSVVPTPSPQPEVKKNLTQMKDAIDEALRTAFGTRTSWFESGDRTVWSATTNSGQFSYDLFLKRSPFNAWDSFDTIVTRKGLVSNRSKTFSLSVDEVAIGAKVYDAKMECYNWTYVIEYKIKEFAVDPNVPQHSYAENFTARLIDVCP